MKQCTMSLRDASVSTDSSPQKLVLRWMYGDAELSHSACCSPYEFSWPMRKGLVSPCVGMRVYPQRPSLTRQSSPGPRLVLPHQSCW